MKLTEKLRELIGKEVEVGIALSKDVKELKGRLAEVGDDYIVLVHEVPMYDYRRGKGALRHTYNIPLAKVVWVAPPREITYEGLEGGGEA